MSKLVSSVFKIILVTMLMVMAYTLTVMIIDLFVTIGRVQSVAEFIQYDIAQNNCLLNDTYESAVAELLDISDRSSYMKVCGSVGNVNNASLKNHYSGKMSSSRSSTLQNQAPIELFGKGKTGTAFTYRDYIQESGQTGKVPPSATATKSGTTFNVANYGDILTMRINAYVLPSFWKPQNTVSSSGWGYGPMINVHLTYNIPALLYLKY